MKEHNILNSKLNSLFWFCIYAFPIILFVFTFCSLSFSNLKGGLSFSDFITLNFLPFLNSFNNVFSLFIPSFISDFFASLFDVLQIESNVIVSFMGLIFGWFVFGNLFHIFIDVILFLPRFVHELIERWF